jgi:thiol-disulfide isomerase/thioredoxin
MKMLINGMIDNNSKQNYLSNLILLRDLRLQKNQNGQRRFDDTFIQNVINLYNKEFFTDEKYKYELLKKLTLDCDLQSLQILLELTNLKADHTYWKFHKYKSDEKDTLLHLLLKKNWKCSKQQKLQTLSLLLRYGANKNQKNWDGRTPFDIVRNYNDPELIALFSDQPQPQPQPQPHYSMQNKSESENISIYEEHENLKEILNKNELNSVIKEANCVLIFYMRGCPYCIALKEVIAELCKNNMKVVVMEKAIIDENLKKEYDINGYPTIYIIKKDGTKELFSGVRSYNEIMSKF